MGKILIIKNADFSAVSLEKVTIKDDSEINNNITLVGSTSNYLITFDGRISKWNAGESMIYDVSDYNGKLLKIETISNETWNNKTNWQYSTFINVNPQKIVDEESKVQLYGSYSITIQNIQCPTVSSDGDSFIIPQDAKYFIIDTYFGPIIFNDETNTKEYSSINKVSIEL